MKVLFKEPNKEAEIREIEDELCNYQKLVDGYIEVIRFPTNNDMDLILNEDGKCLKLQVNVVCPEYRDIFVGNVVAIGRDKYTGEFRSLTDDEIKEAQEYFKLNSVG